MNLKKTAMQYIKHGKNLIDGALIGLNSWSSSRLLEQLELEIGEQYGYKGSLTPVDQLGNPDPKLVDQYYGQINDEEAANRFGTSNLEEYSYWAWRACGVANVATILKTARKYDGKLYQLVSEIRDADGYLSENRWGDTDIGWKHSALKGTLKSRDVQASLATRLSVEGLLAAVAKGALVIASVKSRLSDNGGHMVIVKSFEWNGPETILSIYDPYTLDGEGGERTESLDEFINKFTNKGIVTWIEAGDAEV